MLVHHTRAMSCMVMCTSHVGTSCPFDRVIVVYLKLFLQCTNSNNCTSLGRFSNMMAHSAHCKKICKAKFSARSAVSRRVAGLLNNSTARLVHAIWFVKLSANSARAKGILNRVQACYYCWCDFDLILIPCVEYIKQP